MFSKFAVAAVISFVSLAAQAELRPVPEASLRTYKNVISQALATSQLVCSNQRSVSKTMLGLNGNSLDQVDQIFVDNSGTQPAIMLISGDARMYQTIITIVTSADHKTIVQATKEFKEALDVNHGTLVAPDVRKELVSKTIVTCGQAVVAQPN